MGRRAKSNWRKHPVIKVVLPKRDILNSYTWSKASKRKFGGMYSHTVVRRCLLGRGAKISIKKSELIVMWGDRPTQLQFS